MKRRDFIKTCAGSLVLAGLPGVADATVKREVKAPGPLNIKKLTIKAGASEPFKALHISDSHIPLADRRDVERKGVTAWKRLSVFPQASYYLAEQIRYAEANNLMILHTGDMIDFVSEANLDTAAMTFNHGDWIVCAGNHEFSQYVGEAKEDEPYKAQTYSHVQEAFPNDLTFFSRVVNGINFVAIDDVYYYVSEKQHELFTKEVEKGLPIVMLCHVPFYTPKTCDYFLDLSKGYAASLTGVPLEITSKYDPNGKYGPGEEWRSRAVQQRADKATLDFQAWLREQKLLKAILTGHTHVPFQDQFSKTAMQYVAGAGSNGDGYEISFE